jgi:hypothetical protein
VEIVEAVKSEIEDKHGAIDMALKGNYGMEFPTAPLQHAEERPSRSQRDLVRLPHKQSRQGHRAIRACLVATVLALLALVSAPAQSTASELKQETPSLAATQQAYGRVYGLIQQQAQALAYVDTLWLLAVACLCVLPLLQLAKKNDPSKGGAGAF